MKILIATGLYPPDIGGPATYTRMLEEHLPSHGFELTVVPFGKVRHLPRFLRHIAYTWSIIRAGRNSDILYALDPVSVGLPTLIASRIMRKQFLVRIAGDYAWEQAELQYSIKDLPHEFSKKSMGYPTIILLLKKVQSIVARCAAVVIIPSEYLKGAVVDWGVQQHRVVVIHNIIPSVIESAAKESIREDLNLSGKIIISAGRLIPLKRFEEIISIMPRISQECEKAVLFIIGDGVEREKLKKTVQEKGLTKKVQLLNSMRNSELQRYIKAADVFVLNSVHETFPNVLLESLSVGTAIVATDVGGVPEIIEHEKNGLLVASGDSEALANAIVRLLNDELLQDRISRGGQEIQNRFSTEKIVSKTVKVLRNFT